METAKRWILETLNRKPTSNAAMCRMLTTNRSSAFDFEKFRRAIVRLYRTGLIEGNATRYRITAKGKDKLNGR